MDITIPRIVKAVDVGVESTTKEINAQVDTIVGNGAKYNDGKYTNKYSPRHGKRRKDRGYQTGFVDLQMARQTIKQRSVTKECIKFYVMKCYDIQTGSESYVWVNKDILQIYRV